MNYKDVVIDIKGMLERAEPPISGDCCIYRVPFDIRLLNEDAYTPKVISIGPFHHHHSRLQNMERHKLIYFNNFLQRADVNLETLVIHVEEAEPNVRRSYADTLDLTKEELVKVILVDSCFIIEFFLRFYYGDRSENDGLLLKPWLTTKIRLDLLLLENQIPFFVLESLYDRAFTSATSNNIPSFLELTFDYFAYYNSCNLRSDNVTIRHFTDLLRTFYLQGPIKIIPPTIDEPLKHLRSVAELIESGVRFKVNTYSQCLIDFKFSKGVLKIPRIRVEDWTEILFRNIVALEQCHYPSESYITDYVVVLNFLINTKRDVDALIQSGVLVNWLGDTDSVINLYSGLRKNITHVNFCSYYFHLCHDLNAFCRSPWHRLRATLQRDYGKTPWQAAASFAGIFLLLLSLLQTVCSVLQLVQPYNAS